ncbi:MULTISPECIES: class I SAM-dependent methyltransferase [unclassified Rhizobium]|uniref:class I SAM-dependent methyltransferase n=1 Tax=unclassified Rhizobium TaxID=2613769 RepID=UPI000BDD68CC|nr:MULTISPECIES: class I SAM-dependent methyltransferase [unclassified Rhizobium]MDH7810033.1 SAM-dependent methyltransferase [Rhizobium sp. AN67]MDQ4408674.1 methyltransferase domain-containing protein [Rhizobium sp. AN63]SOD50246.1 Methyltransferase domain-containing protein [Rhizobium sp. AN6A]
MSDPQTVHFYNENAARYAGFTAGLSMTQQIDQFLNQLPTSARVLDLGCGSGRDLKYLAEHGCDALGLDISLGLARHAAAFAHRPVVVADIAQLPFSTRSFDGIWASASFLHLRRGEMTDGLLEARRVIRPRGTLFTSLKMGKGESRTSDQRFFTYVMPDEWEAMLRSAGFLDVRLEFDQEFSKNGEKWIRAFAS